MAAPSAHAPPSDFFYAVSQKKRKRIEACFGRNKAIALLRKLKHGGTLQSRMVLLFRGCGLQPGASADTDSECTGGLLDRSVSESWKSAPKATKTPVPLTAKPLRGAKGLELEANSMLFHHHAKA